ncbi:MAG: agmatine deiminase family protein, partial [Rhodanobacteraceae bacterium]
AFADTPLRTVDWALEGGAIESDGQGSVLTTWHCMHARHPDLTREQIARHLAAYLHADRVLWLDSGALQGDDTDAHIDTLARFAPGDRIVYQACDAPDDPHHDDLARMAEELAALRTGTGKPYTLIALPWPRAIVEDGRRLAASYANYLVINDAVLVPAYGDPADTQATMLIGQAHPGREIIPIPCRPLISQNGSLHCITMQLPVGVLG